MHEFVRLSLTRGLLALSIWRRLVDSGHGEKRSNSGRKRKYDSRGEYKKAINIFISKRDFFQVCEGERFCACFFFFFQNTLYLYIQHLHYLQLAYMTRGNEKKNNKLQKRDYALTLKTTVVYVTHHYLYLWRAITMTLIAK